MKKLSSLALTAVLVCGMAIPAAAEGGTMSTGNGNNAATTQSTTGNGATMNRTNNLGTGTYDRTTNQIRGTTGTNGYNRSTMGTNGTNRGVTGYGTGMNNTTRAYAAGDDDGVDWGWLGLAGLLGLAGMRGRERNKS